MKVTVCSFDSPDYVGGPNSWLRRLIPALRAKGVAVDLLCFLGGGRPEDSSLITEARSHGAACRTSPSEATTEARMRWILGELVASPPDVFVPNMIVSAFFAARWAREAGIPTIGLMHSDDEFHRGLARQFALGSEPFRLSAFVCVSRYLADSLSRDIAALPGGSHVTRVVHLPYGVPIPERAASWDPERLGLVWVGRLVDEQKRATDVARALVRVVREVPGARAAMFGKGEARPAIERTLRAGGPLPIRLGYVPNEKMLDELAGHQVAVLLSEYEGLPVYLLEAMACGVVPVCKTTRSGIGDLVEEGVTGLLLGGSDPETALVAATRRLKSDPDLWRRLSRAARARAAAEYSLEAHADRWIALLESLRREAPPRGALRMPDTISLPPVDAGLAREDWREGGLVSRAGRRLRRLVLG